MRLEDFLTQKRIDVESFKTAQPDLWAKWESLFQQISPQSFDQQKKFEFNPIRLAHPSKEPIQPKSPTKAKPVPKRATGGETSSSDSKKLPLKKRPALKGKKKISLKTKDSSTEDKSGAKNMTDSPKTALKKGPPLKGRKDIKLKTKNSEQEENSKEEQPFPKPKLKKGPPLKGRKNIQLKTRKKPVEQEKNAPISSEPDLNATQQEEE
ncbi:MAG: hypothetical protein AAFY71_16475 [Bacteroidota bacterium]